MRGGRGGRGNATQDLIRDNMEDLGIDQYSLLMIELLFLEGAKSSSAEEKLIAICKSSGGKKTRPKIGKNWSGGQK